MADFLKDILASVEKEQPPPNIKMSRQMESKDELAPPQTAKQFKENNVLVVKNFSQDREMKEICIYLPTSFKFYLNELKQVNFIQNRCQCQATVGLEIYYGDLEDHLRDQLLFLAKIGSTVPTLKKDNLHAILHNPSYERLSAAERRRSVMSNMESEEYQHFNERGYLAKMYLDHQRPVYLAKGQNITVEHKKFEKIIKFAISEKFDFKMDADIFWFPISQLRVKMGLYIESIVLDHSLAIGYSTEGSLVRIMLNFMYTDQNPIIADEANLGSYQFALSLARCQLTIKKPEPTKRKTKKNIPALPAPQGEEIDFEAIEEQMGENDPPIPFQRAKVGFGMYTISGIYIARSFFRFKFLGILVMFNFFTAASFAGRMGRLAFLTVGLFALMPVMQASLPVTTSLVLPQILVIIEQINVLLCVVSSYQGRNNDYTTGRYKWEEDPWFITTLVLHVLSVIVTVGQYLYFKCVTEAQFNLPPEQQNEEQQKTIAKNVLKMMFAVVSTKLVVADWKNTACRRHFKSFKRTVHQTWKSFMDRPHTTDKYLQVPIKI